MFSIFMAAHIFAAETSNLIYENENAIIRKHRFQKTWEITKTTVTTEQDCEVYSTIKTKFDHLPMVLRLFEPTGRLEGYLDNATYPIDTPLGIYIAYEKKDKQEIPVAILSYGDPTEGERGVSASRSTNVLEAFERKGYGSLIRAKSIEYASQFLGTQMEYRGVDGNILSRPLLTIHSDCEWGLGRNYPSLGSSLKAGFGITYIDKHGNLSMSYTNDYLIRSAFWSQDKLDALVRFSKYIMKINAEPLPAIIEEGLLNAKESMMHIVYNLDFTQETDLMTFLSLCQSVLRKLNFKWVDEYGNTQTYDSCEGNIEETPLYKSIYAELCLFFKRMNEEQLILIENFANGIPATTPQKVQLDGASNQRFIKAFGHFEELRIL